MKKVKLGEIGKIVTGKTPSTKNISYFGGDYLFITPSDLHKKWLIEKTERSLSQNGFKSILSNTINGLSILVGCIGWDMGNVALVEKCCATNQQINAITQIKPEYNPYYIYYWLTTKKDYLFKVASVTRTPILNKTTFEELLIPIPSKLTQDNIANFLSSIDKKIELNNKISKELEAMAKALYDYWFVQFDFPDKNGKPYKSSGGLMLQNETLKREIPKGWSIESLNKTELCSIIPVGIKQFHGEKTYLATADVSGTEIVSHNENTSYENRVSRANMQPTLNSVWFAKMKNTVKHLLINISAKELIKNYIFSTGFCGLQCNENTIYYIWNYLRNDYFEKKKDTVASGATQQAINDDDLSGFFVVIPPDELLKQFYAKVSSFYALINRNKFENIELATLRDFLLPMLMNGQIQVTEAGNIINKTQSIKKQDYNQRFELWLNNQKLAARGEIDIQTLREMFDAMDDDDK